MTVVRSGSVVVGKLGCGGERCGTDQKGAPGNERWWKYSISCVALWLHRDIFVTTHQTEYLASVHLIVCKLYLNF